MFTSIKDDIKLQFQSGNMLTRIILVNIAVFVFIKMVMVFTSFGEVTTIYTKMLDILSLHGDAPKVYFYFWSWITHMFLHEGTWHLIWNMLLLYWFGRIVGDFLGDERMLPLYILGGLAGGVFYVGFEYFLPGSGSGSMAMGASAAVMCMLLTAAMVSPDYHLHLLLIGPVKLKWIAVVMLFFDLVGTAGQVNTGGHFAHLGGALFGILYVTRLHSGQDLTSGLQKFFDFLNNRQEPIKPAPTKKAAMSVVYHKGNESTKRDLEGSESESFQKKLDTILDKINDKGFDNLSDEEKDFLSQASKKE